MGRAGEPNAKRFNTYPAHAHATPEGARRLVANPVMPSEPLVGPLLLVVPQEEPFDDQDEPDEERDGEQQMAHAITVRGARRRRPEPLECLSPP